MYSFQTIVCLLLTWRTFTLGLDSLVDTYLGATRMTANFLLHNARSPAHPTKSTLEVLLASDPLVNESNDAKKTGASQTRPSTNV